VGRNRRSTAQWGRIAGVVASPRTRGPRSFRWQRHGGSGARAHSIGCVGKAKLRQPRRRQSDKMRGYVRIGIANSFSRASQGAPGTSALRAVLPAAAPMNTLCRRCACRTRITRAVIIGCPPSRVEQQRSCTLIRPQSHRLAAGRCRTDLAQFATFIMGPTPGAKPIAHQRFVRIIPVVSCEKRLYQNCVLHLLPAHPIV